jgi:uncharacterized HAD superfamily protein
MQTLNIALDIEGVLADTHSATAERSDFLTEDECPPPNWDFPSEQHREEFMHVSQNLWHNHTHHIPPMMDGVWKPTRLLSQHHNVDIVTSRTGVTPQLRDWLTAYNIHYDSLHISHHSKNDIDDYDVHIEDSPQVSREALADGRSVVLIEHEYNDSYRETIEREASLWRVSDLSEAATILTSSPLDL